MKTTNNDNHGNQEVADDGAGTSKTVSFPAASKPESVNLSTLDNGAESVKQSVSLQDGGTIQPTEGAETMPVMTAVRTAKPHPTVRRRVVSKSRTAQVPTVETAKIDVTTPLVGSVGAGTRTATGTGTITAPTILSLIQQIAEVGKADQINGNPENHDSHSDPGFMVDLSSSEHEMIAFLRRASSSNDPRVLDYPGHIADMLSPQGGNTPEEIVNDYYEWRAARRSLCGQLRQFIAAVEEDDARRDTQEEAVFPLSFSEKKERGEAQAAQIIDGMTSLARRIATTIDNEGGEGFVCDGIMDHFLTASESMPLRDLSTEQIGFLASLIFGKKLVPNEADSINSSAFGIAAIFLDATRRKNWAAESLLQTAAIVAHQMNQASKAVAQEGGTN